MWAAALGVLALLVASRAAAQIPSPEDHFGFQMGADGRLATTDDIDRYFELIAARSDRVKIVDLGATTENHRTIAAIVSSAENIRNLDRIREVNQRLADPRLVEAAEARQLVAAHKAVVVIGGSIHATEIGATQAANEMLFSLANASDAATLNILQNVVVILIPSLNPDGHRLVVDWYNKYKGTMYDGGPMPWLDHKYTGHDINRDAFMMNMVENRNLARFFYTVWHPQVFLTMHQMGSDGPRFFAPPNADPIHPNYDPLIWREAALLGSAMTLQLERDRHAGVVSNAIYDYYWPGYEDSAPLGHNTVCLLTEAAGVRVASPLTIAPQDLRGGDKGLPEYKPQINFPNPWPGGRWRLRDIVEYDLSAVRGLLEAAAAYREPLVQNFYDMGARAIADGARGGPFAFIIPPDQKDALATRKLEEVLLLGGIEIFRAIEPFRADGDPYPPGTDVIMMAQPYRAYVKTLLERQDYPGRRAPTGNQPDRPYDVTAWTLPAQFGVDVRTIERTFEPPSMSRITSATLAPGRVWGDRKPTAYVVDAHGDAGVIATNRLLAANVATSWTTKEVEAGGYRYPAGSLVVLNGKNTTPIVEAIATDLGLRVEGVRTKSPTAPGIGDAKPLGRARVGLYKPWVDNIDEGWTRWLLEQYGFGYKTLTDADARMGNLRAAFDVIILPSMAPDRLMNGLSTEVLPPEYAGGLGPAGADALKTFVTAGGTLICLDQSCGFAVDQFQLPVVDVARAADPSRFSCPGSLLRIELDATQPLAYGMEPKSAGFFSNSSAYEVTAPGPSIATLATYAQRDLLVSGWLEGEQVIAGKAAALRATVGAGQVVLLGFRVQHRGQSLATFRLLFNAVIQAGQAPVATASRTAAAR